MGRAKRGKTIDSGILINAMLSLQDNEGNISGEKLQAKISTKYKHKYSASTIKGRIKLINAGMVVAKQSEFRVVWERKARRTEADKLSELLQSKTMKRKLAKRQTDLVDAIADKKK